MREGLTRQLWPAAVVLAFCIPLFYGLDRTDLENDEAIYSYAVDGILATGDWLNPLVSPHDDAIFLEKPPLKFWIVAAPIKLGLLPHNEIGLRVVDALFGAVGFVYVFLIGRRLEGPVCGFIAVMTLFVYPQLLFEHGIRGNNMEGPLFLCYCGGMFHYLAWTSAEESRRRRAHVLAIAGYFFLGFMTKFVAALFLPFVLGLTGVLFRSTRRKLWHDRRYWVMGALLVIVAAAPWFIYQQLRVGWALWETMLQVHVYDRFTTSVDPTHVQPWDFYFTRSVSVLRRTQTLWLVAAGGALLALRTIVKRWADGALVLLWFAAPLAVMSLGTSKLHHYLYPFLPPLALAAGYGPARFLLATRPVTDRFLAWAKPRTVFGALGNAASTIVVVLAFAAVVVFVVTLVSGPFRWQVAGVTVFRNTDVWRPLQFAVVAALIAGHPALSPRVLALVVLVCLLPFIPYQRTLATLSVDRHPLRSARECLIGVRDAERAAGRPGPGILAVMPDKWLLHSYYYYFRHVTPFERAHEVDPKALAASLSTEGHYRPVLIDDADYQAFKARHPMVDRAMPIIGLPHVLLLLPGPYRVCGPSEPR